MGETYERFFLISEKFFSNLFQNRGNIIIILNENRQNQINALYNEKNAHIDPREASEAKPRRPRGG